MEHKECYMFDTDVESFPGAQDAPRLSENRITVFPDRDGFVQGITRILNAGTGSCAVLHIKLCLARDHAGLAGRKLLSRAGKVLRAGIRAGAGAYFGGGEFGVLLQDVDARAATAFANDVAESLSMIARRGNDGRPVLTVQVGGVMARHSRDGAALLKLADVAGEAAVFGLGGPAQMLSTPEEFPRIPWRISFWTN
ncbi:MAG: hypothetical protein ACM3ZT_04330 [Bacillota bacterium]